MTKLLTLLAAVAVVVSVGQLTDANPVCHPVTCDIFCPDGFAKDNNGCDICDCNSPCENTPPPCAANETLMRKRVPETDTSPVHYICECSVCRPVWCVTFCPYGFVTDNNGCQTCQCYNPCKNSTLKCDANSKLEVKKVQDSATSVDQYTCECSACSAVKKCLIYCPYGHLVNENGCEICDCNQPCKNTALRCKANEKPGVVDIQESKAGPIKHICQCLPVHPQR